MITGLLAFQNRKLCCPVRDNHFVNTVSLIGHNLLNPFTLLIHGTALWYAYGY